MFLRTLSYFPHVYKSQYVNADTLRKIQEKKLRYLVNHAYRNIPLYRKKFKKANITPSDITAVDNIIKLPLTTKDDIKAAYPGGTCAPGCSEETCLMNRTSGSSGNILNVLYDSKSFDFSVAVVLRAYIALGIKPWHTFGIICRDPEELKSMTPQTFGISGALPERDLVHIARERNPHILGGHPHTFVAMAKFMENRGITDLNIPIILLGGELAYPLAREYIERIFKGKTFNKYGSFETRSIAWECLHKNMHIDADAVLLEVLKDGEPVAPGEPGEVVVTNLWNMAMPFIRYKLDDVAALSDADDVCPCGRTLPLLKDLKGRCDDFIVLPSGDLIPPLRISPCFFSVSEIDQFKIIQDAKTHMVIQVVFNTEDTADIEKALVSTVNTALGGSIDIELEIVDHIPQTGDQKFKRFHRTFSYDTPF
jgi:phenylacetate-CoA ligase